MSRRINLQENKKQSIELLSYKKIDNVLIFEKTEKQGFVINYKNHQFLFVKNNQQFMIHDKHSGVLLISSKDSFESAYQELKNKFSKYLLIRETREYKDTCEMFKNAKKYSQLRFDI